MSAKNGLWLPVALLLAPLVAGAATAPATAPAAAPDAAPVDAVWIKHERQFSYMGVTSRYSCDGLESKLKALLRLAGARDDLKVIGSCSNPSSGPSRMSSARMTYWTLALPGSPQATPPAASVKNLGHAAKELKVAEPPVAGVGQWKQVELRADHGLDFQAGDCELIEQFDREALADFTIRNHASSFTCVPHQLTLGGVQMRFETLAPLPKAAAKPVSR